MNLFFFASALHALFADEDFVDFLHISLLSKSVHKEVLMDDKLMIEVWKTLFIY